MALLARSLRERGVRRLVLLGDALEMRHGPQREALAAAAPVLGALGAAVEELVLVPGNHDHALLGPWLERRRRESEPPPLELEENVDWQAGEPLARLARAAQPAAFSVAYPGLRLRQDVFATHGHYLDIHLTVPTFERLGVGLMGRVTGSMPERATPEDYERHLEPLYAWLGAVAEHAPPGRRASGAGASVRAWRALSGSGGHRVVRLLALRAAATVALRAANRAGLGPLQTDVANLDLRRATLAAMREVVSRLGIDADHVLFGHTHRSGPWGENGDWRAPGGARLWNTGCWVFERHYLSRTPGESPYWPGVAIALDADGPPRLERLLGVRGSAELAPL
ncbi:MAG: hypothetical protein JWN32_213 [Solirubrobacterales bacterium]|nr:hypothetical protein [Solirubrobacterales bacterium]